MDEPVNPIKAYADQVAQQMGIEMFGRMITQHLLENVGGQITVSLDDLSTNTENYCGVAIQTTPDGKSVIATLVTRDKYKELGGEDGKI